MLYTDIVFLFLCLIKLDLVVQSVDGTVTSVELINAAFDLEKTMNASHAEVGVDYNTWLLACSYTVKLCVYFC